MSVNAEIQAVTDECGVCWKMKRSVTGGVCRRCTRLLQLVNHDPKMAESMRSFLEALHSAAYYRPIEEENSFLKEEVQNLRGQLRGLVAAN